MVECPKCGSIMKFKNYSLTSTKGLKKIYVCKNRECNYKMFVKQT